jgi:hypothetical protein
MNINQNRHYLDACSRLRQSFIAGAPVAAGARLPIDMPAGYGVASTSRSFSESEGTTAFRWPRPDNNSLFSVEKVLAGGGQMSPSNGNNRPPTGPASGGRQQHTPYYPSHFMRGTVIQLASGELKRVEELIADDFIQSAHLSHELRMDSSTVVRVEEKDADAVLLCFSVGEHKVQVL